MATPPDNSAAEAITTAPEAMAASAYNCVSGDDTTCVTAYGAGACCFMASVEDATQTEEQKAYNVQQAQIGWPTAAGEENTFCLDPANKVYYAAFTALDEGATFAQFYTGVTMKGYCVSAVKVAATLSAAAAAVFATTF